MNTFPSFPLLVASGALLLASCDTVDRSRSGAARPARVASQRQGAPQAYYGADSQGRYYSETGEGLNSEYQPPVKRFDPARRKVSTSPSVEGSSWWRKPADLSGTEYEY